MSVLNPISTVTVTARRPTEDPDGNKVFTTPASIQAVFSLQGAVKAGFRSHGERYVQDGVVFVPRGTDLLPGDEITYNSRTFVVVGHARGNQDHPFTGEDFGWVSYTLSGGG